MKKTLLLLAGYPGTGKTYFADMVIQQHPEFHLHSQDVIKEHFFDTYGFANIDEKKAVVTKAREYYYQKMEYYMQQGKSIISDYPFSYKQKPIFERLSVKYNYQVITVRFIGDTKIIYNRQRNRDLDASRHVGHMASKYYKGDRQENRSSAGDLIPYEKFLARGKDRGYETFALGHVIDVDTTDFSKVDYESILETIAKLAT